MEIKLFEHNETAFIKLKEFLKNHILASIDHATGTGKSFITLKYLYENRDKRILYLTPTYAIYDQLFDVHMKKLGIDKKDFKCFDNIIYPNILKKNMNDLAENYDIIVWDEYHRCGAKKWGKKIKKLKEIIVDNYPEKRIIGLTATNIRYLDNERDMNAELFDGNCVSRLTLDESILKGLLPSPTYINTYSSCDMKLEKLKNFIIKIMPYKDEQKKYLDLISNISNLNEEKSRIEGEYKLPRENGKYIVFCSTIKDIKKNQKFISDRFSDKKLTFYEVHSNKKKEKNNESLKEFRENKDSNAFIFVVDILNEGIHVDDIDGIFMMRKTTSPIIFFQQLGRLLSFSGKNRKLVVWDLVNNLENHPVIYKLIENVTSQAREKLLTDLENTERYERILENFKIIDHTTAALTKINELEKVLENVDYKKIRIEKMLKILVDSEYPDKEEWEIAHKDLFRYHRYLTLEQFKIIFPLKIFKPIDLDCTEDEFKEKLHGFNTLHERDENLIFSIFNQFEEFVNKNNRVPSILNDDVKERELAIKITELESLMNKEMLKKYKELYGRIKNVSPFDRAFYGKKVSELQFKEIAEGCRFCAEKGIEINRNLKSLVRRIAKSTKNVDFVNFGDILEVSPFAKIMRIGSYNNIIIEYTKNIRKEKEAQKKKTSKERIIKKENFEETEELYIELIDFLYENLRYPQSKDGEIYKKFIFYKNFLIKYNYKESLDYILETQKKKFVLNNRSELFKKIVDFMNVNEGDFPYDNVDDKEEAKLAKELKKQHSKFTTEEIDFLNNLHISLSDNNKFLKEYLEFIIINKRYPIKNIGTEREHYLHLKFLRNEHYLTKEDLRLIKDTVKKIGEQNLIRNTFLERTRLTKIFQTKQQIYEIIEFVNNNFGYLPSEFSIEKKEKELALNLGNLSEDDKIIIFEHQKKVLEKYNFDIVGEYIKFINENHRYPLKESDDEMERAIAIKYEREYRNLSLEEIAKVDAVINIIGKNILYENTYIKNTRK